MTGFIKENKKTAVALFHFVESNPRATELRMTTWVESNSTLDYVDAARLVQEMISDGAFHPAG
jgi:hypothetical protein